MNKDVDIKLLTLEGTKAYFDDLDAFFMAAVDNGSIGEAAVERREQVVSESMAYFPQSDNPDLSQLALRQSPHLRAVSSYPAYVWISPSGSRMPPPRRASPPHFSSKNVVI